MPQSQDAISLEPSATGFIGHFTAMASDCEVHVETDDRDLVSEVVDVVHTEAMRIHDKFSRYRTDNIVYEINSSDGTQVSVDDETAQLLEFANSAPDQRRAF